MAAGLEPGAGVRRSPMPGGWSRRARLVEIPGLRRRLFGEQKSRHGHDQESKVKAEGLCAFHLEFCAIFIRDCAIFPGGHLDFSQDQFPDNVEKFSVRIRIPDWAMNEAITGNLYRFDDQITEGYKITVNDAPVDAEVEDGYAEIKRRWEKVFGTFFKNT